MLRKRRQSWDWSARLAACGLWVSGAAFAWTLCACARKPEPPPNVILISVDTLRADHMGAYGYARDTTPNLDRFFADATVFEAASSPSPCTLPAVPQVLSSAYLVAPERPTLAEILSRHGYVTAAIASQRQFRPGRQRDERVRALAAAVSRGFLSFDLQKPYELDANGLSTRDASEISDRAIAWLADFGGDEPFFLWLHYLDPHDPYSPPARYRRFGSQDASEGDGDRRRLLKAGARAGEPWQNAGHIFDAQTVTHFVDLYDGEILYTDAEIQRVLDALASAGLVERSIIVFFADHGEWLGEQGRWDHCQTMYDVELRVPLFIKVRGGRLGQQARRTEPVSTLDLVPTVLGLIGLGSAAEGMNGRDLRTESDASVFAAWRERAAVRRGPWKLQYDGRPTGLFDVSSDPGEAKNRIGEGLPQEAELNGLIERFIASHPDLSEQNSEVLERLRAIGYIE